MAHTTWLEYQTVTFESMTCDCGVRYALALDFIASRKKENKGWVCPNGCKRIFRKSEADFMREKLERSDRELQRERQRHDQTRADRDHIEAKRRGEKAAKTRIKNRIAAGVCPCCNRTFQNLAKHMAGQHPDFTPEPTHD